MQRLISLLVGTLVATFATVASAEEIAVGNYGTSANGMPFAVALAKGYFQEEGANVTGIIASFQMVIQPLLLTEAQNVGDALGRVPQSTQLYMVDVYKEFFYGHRFGYGSAMLWVFFVIILVITLLVQRSSRLWVHYQVDNEQDR